MQPKRIIYFSNSQYLPYLSHWFLIRNNVYYEYQKETNPNERRHTMQYGRKAFGPRRKQSEDGLARDIVTSIQAHRAKGIVRTGTDYAVSPTLISKVEAMLKAA
jgi:hypothetical protein